MMQFNDFRICEPKAITSLFYSVFSLSEGEEEGLAVCKLARDLMVITDESDLYGFVAVDEEHILGAIFFSRLTFETGIEAFILAPVAVDSDHQGEGIGQELINHGLQQLKQAGVSLVMTYGDPAYYTRVGFKPVSQDVIQPPHKLTQPVGWIGQSFKDDSSISTSQGACRCVQALDDASYW